MDSVKNGIIRVKDIAKIDKIVLKIVAVRSQRILIALSLFFCYLLQIPTVLKKSFQHENVFEY